MARDKNDTAASPHEGVISIIGPGMRVVGDCETEGTLRIEGVVEGTVRAGKGVVVGKEGSVTGDIVTQDAIIGGRVVGTVVAESRLELQATCQIDGEIHALRIKLEEGGRVNGQVHTGQIDRQKLPATAAPRASLPAASAPAGPPARPVKVLAGE